MARDLLSNLGRKPSVRRQNREIPFAEVNRAQSKRRFAGRMTFGQMQTTLSRHVSIVASILRFLGHVSNLDRGPSRSLTQTSVNRRSSVLHTSELAQLLGSSSTPSPGVNTPNVRCSRVSLRMSGPSRHSVCNRAQESECRCGDSFITG